MSDRSFEQEMEDLVKRSQAEGVDKSDDLVLFASCCVSGIVPPFGVIFGMIMFIRREAAYGAMALTSAVGGLAVWYMFLVH